MGTKLALAARNCAGWTDRRRAIIRLRSTGRSEPARNLKPAACQWRYSELILGQRARYEFDSLYFRTCHPN